MLRNLLFTLALLTVIPALTACNQPALAGEIDPSHPEMLASLQPMSAGVWPSDETSWDNPPWRPTYVHYLETEIAENHIPGLAVAVVQGREVVLLRVFGWRDIAAGEAVTPDTLFHIGSAHTSMTAMMLAALVDDGYLDWGTPAVDILPGFELSDPEATQSVTIRHLLGMQGGLPAELSPEYEAGLAAENITPADLFDLVAEKQFVGRPGEQLHYSSLSTAVAGYLGVLAAGGDFHNLRDDYAYLLQRKVLDPIGMETATTYASEARQSGNLSKSYTLSENGEPVLAVSEDNDEAPFAPAYSLKASINDMALYINTQLNQGLAPNHNRVVSAVNLTETWQSNGDDYGLGWEIENYAGRQILLQRGAYDNFASVIGIIPQLDMGLVILLNSEEAGAELIQEAPYMLVRLLTQ